MDIAVPSPIPPKPIYGFMHVAQMNHWHLVVSDQVRKIMSSGLLDATKAIYLGVLGPSGDLCFDQHFMKKVRVGFRDLNIKLFEFPTLRLLEEVCAHEDCQVWYIHTKGVSNPGYKHEENWRKLMEYFLLEHWQKCVKVLETHDLAGVMWRPRGHFMPHYAGNFWWANSDYIRKLPPVKNLNWHDRFQAEVWNGMCEPKRVASLWETPVDFRHKDFIKINFPAGVADLPVYTHTS